MKPIISALLLVSFATAGFSQRVQSSCIAPDSIINLYSNDAATLAYHIAVKRDSTFTDSVNIPKGLEDSVLQALLAVFNSGLRAADTITGKINLHGYKFGSRSIFVHNDSYPSFSIFSIEEDTTIAWERNLAHNINPTGNSGIDSLINEYGIIVDSIENRVQFQIWMHTKNLCNILALMGKWDKITVGAPYAESDYSNEYQESMIFLNVFDSTIQLTYRFGWEDCPSGCIQSREWRFTVFPNCYVQFDSSFGDDMELENVKLFSNMNNNLIFHPNPASNKITIETQPQSKIEIIDVTGSLLNEIQSNSDKEEIDVSKLPSGIYFIKASDKRGKIGTAKFVKE